MIWSSRLLMLLIDLAIIIVICYAAITLYQRRNLLNKFHAIAATGIMLAGLGVCALFYLTDIIVMFILPVFMPMTETIEIMEDLHLNYHWLVMIIAMPLLVIGLAHLIKKIIPHYSARLDDLTHEQHKLEQRSTYLERLVYERTAELRKALIVAEESNKAKSEFLSNMSHELRTPLNSILGFGQLLARKQVNQFTEDDKDHVNEIVDAGYHLLELINDMLDLSSFEAGHFNLSSEATSLNTLLPKCIAMIQPLASQRGIRLNNHVKSDSGYMVYVDGRRFKQVVLNLLSNAVKYNRENGEVTLSCQMLSDGYLRLLIADEGIGIDDEDKQHVFESFGRVASNKARVGGVGIGLAITKKLIEAMGGKIGFESTLGQGSSFWVDIPLAEAAPI